MAAYRYTAENDQGQQVSGQIEASSPEQAKRLLEQQGLIVAEIVTVDLEAQSDSETPATLSQASADELTQQIVRVSSAHLPMADGLRAAARESIDRHVANALRQMADRMDRGETLETILSGSQQLLPRPVAGLILAAARTGNLGGALVELSEHQRTNHLLRREMLSSFAYPLFVLLLATGVFTVTFIYVTDIFAQMFREFSLALPFFTRVLLWWHGTGIWIIAGIILLAMVFAGLYGLRTRRSGWLRLVSSIPLFGPIVYWSGVTDWSGLLSVLLRHEVPLPEALRLAGHGIRNAHVGELSLRLADGVSRGRSTSDMVAATHQLPASLVPLIRWGEQTGSLAESFAVSRIVFEKRMRVRTMLLRTLLPPILFTLIGCSVVFLVVGLFMPLVSLISALS